MRLWKIYQDEWCEHKPSITVYYTPDEFMHVAAWMWDNFDSLLGNLACSRMTAAPTNRRHISRSRRSSSRLASFLRSQ